MSIGASRGTPKETRTRAWMGHNMQYGVPHAHASKARAVETSSPPPWRSAWPTQQGQVGPGAT
eukprot:7312511-Lingulodinium_polyedra.AAC.1